MEDHQLCDTRRTCCLLAIASTGGWFSIPAPRTRAAVDSFLNSFAEDDVPATTAAAFEAASDAEGAMSDVNCRKDNITGTSKKDWKKM